MSETDQISTAAAQFRHARQPITINGCTIRNRIVRTAHATGYASGSVSEQLIAYHEARSRGGLGLLITEIAGVHRTSPGSINLYRPDAVDGLAALANRVHAHGAKVFQQLWHGGPNAHSQRAPAYSASPVAEAVHGRIPVEMSQTMIDEIVDAFAAGAARCREAGLDGVELHGAHGYLVGAFMSPATNHRTDDYGGSIENRCLLAEQVLTAIRASVGADFPVGIRLSATEAMPGGLEPDETLAMAQRLERLNLVDFVDVSIGNSYTFPKFIGAMHEPLGYQLPKSAAVTRKLAVPTIVAGRIMNLHDADRIIAEGVADMVSMVRATIADPDLVKKSFDGQPERVRPCLSCNQGCIGGVLGESRTLGCVVNPEAGRESRPRPLEHAPKPRRVVIIGGGPSGLEAAWTATHRGHQVILCEAADQLGGQVRVARRAPFRQDIAAITDWLSDELDRLDVDVRTGTPVDVADILDLAPDVVILATGSDVPGEFTQRSRPGFDLPGGEQDHVVSALELFDSPHLSARRALVFDDLGDYIAPSVAEYLLERGAAIEFVTSLGSLAQELGNTLQRDPVRARLVAHDNFSLHTRLGLVSIGPTSVDVVGIDDGRFDTIDADLVVLVGAQAPRRELVAPLQRAGCDVHVVGDAIGSSTIQDAISSARSVALTI